MSLLDAFWSIVAPEEGKRAEDDAEGDGERRKEEDEEEHASASAEPSRPRLRSVDFFNEGFSALHLALAESRTGDAFRLLRSVEVLARDDEARKDMVAALKARLLPLACSALTSFSTGAISFPDALHLWQTSLVQLAGAAPATTPLTGNVKLVQEAFVGSLTALFSESAADVLRRMDTVRSLLSVGGAMAAPSQEKAGDEDGSKQPLRPDPVAAKETSGSSYMPGSGLSAAARFFFSSSSGAEDGGSAPSSPGKKDKNDRRTKNYSGPHPYLVRHKRPIHLALKGSGGQDSAVIAARRREKQRRGGESRYRYADGSDESESPVDEDEMWSALEAVAAMGADDEDAATSASAAGTGTSSGGSGQAGEGDGSTFTLADEAGSTQPHIEALSTLFGDATQLMMAIVEQPFLTESEEDRAKMAPLLNACKREAVDALHRVCTAAAVQALKAYRGDTMLDSTLLLATQTLHQVLDADAAGTGGIAGTSSTSNTRLMRAICGAAGIPFEILVKLTSPPAVMASLSDVGLPRGLNTAVDQELVVLDIGTGAAFKPAADDFLTALKDSAAVSAAFASDGGSNKDYCALPLGMAVSIVDETADQISFLCQLLERYSRCLAFCSETCGPAFPSSESGRAPSSDSSTNGNGKSKSKKGERDPLLLTLWELQGHYVQLERSYLLSSVRLALLPPNGWKVVSVHEDSRVRTYAWCDNLFFLLSKGVSRAAATCADMAAAAVTNYVAGCCDDILKRVLYACAAVGSGLVRSLKDPRLDSRHLKRMLMDVVSAANHQSASDSVVASILLGSMNLEEDDSLESFEASGESSHEGESEDGLGGNQLTRLLQGSRFGHLQAPGPGKGDASARWPQRGGASGAAAVAEHEEDAFEAEIAASFKAAFRKEGTGEDEAETEEEAAAKRKAAAKLAAQDEGSAEQQLLASVASFPVASETAILCVNTVATAGQYSAALFERTSAELSAVFPAPNQDASNNSVPACSPLLVVPLAQLREASETCGPNLLQLATKTFASTVCRAGVKFFDGVLRKVDYVLPSAAAFDALSGAHDPVLTAVTGPVLSGSAFQVTLPLLLKPHVSDAFVLELSAMLASRIDKRWSQAAVNEYGALLMASQLRSLYNTLSPYVKTAHAPLRSLLASGRLHQMVQVLNVESLSDLTGLMFPVPALNKQEVCRLLNNRVGFLSAAKEGGGGGQKELSEAATKVLATVPWHRVPIAGDRE